MFFWPLAAFAVLMTILISIRPLVAARAEAAPRAAHDLQVFRDQLSALDRDVERGVLTEEEAGGARAEISRRLLAAAAEAERAAGAAPGPAGAARALSVGLAVLIVVGGAGVYWWIGAPGAADQPLSARLAEIESAAPARPSQQEAEAIVAARREAAAARAGGDGGAAEPSAQDAELAERAAELQRILADRPDDVRGRRLLAGVLMSLGRPGESLRVHEEILDILGETAEADDLVGAAEAMILTVEGYVSPEAESRIARALQKSPTNQIGRYYAGLAMAQNGQFGLALNLWRSLLDEGPPDAPWIPAIEAQIGDLARAAGEGVDETPGLRGPDAEDMEAARDMTPEDRARMIEGMVAGLEERLATEGGGPEEWERLLNAYRVLGRPDDAARVWSDVERAFADAPPEVVARLRDAARAAGVDVPPR